MSSRKITFRNGTELRFFSKEKECSGCKHFCESVKTESGQGLCALYSIVVLQDSDCRFGFEPKEAPVTVQGQGENSLLLYDDPAE